MKKILAVFLAVITVFSAFAVAASAKSAESGLIYDEMISNKPYFHMEYVEEQNFFENKINLYTNLGLYANAWENAFNGEVDIDYATAILLAVIEKVDVDYQNENFEKFIGVLEGASDVADVIDKVNEYTGILDFAETSAWASSISVLNTVIKVANYSNEMYETFIRGYASILSARAASIFYGDFLRRIADNCENKAVRIAAQDILENINGELEDAVKKLVDEILIAAGEDAATLGVEIAMSTNTVTAAISTAYNVTTGLSEKLFKTSSMYEYMCSLAEIYYIENCVLPWAEDNILNKSDNELLVNFTVNALLTLRRTGEELLKNLAVTKDKTLASLARDYNVDEIKVRTAVAAAKLNAVEKLIALDEDLDFAAVYCATGDGKMLVRSNGTFAAFFKSGADSFKKTNVGYVYSEHNDVIGTDVKVLFVDRTAANIEASVYDNNLISREYLQLDTLASGSLAIRYATVAVDPQTRINAIDIANRETPAIFVKVGDLKTAESVFEDDFSVSAMKLNYTLITEEEIEIQPSREGNVSTTFRTLFAKIALFFKKLFNIFK